MEELQIIDPTKTRSDKVYFGAYVRLEDEDENEQIYRIVGPDEFDPKSGQISMDSPMGKALMGKSEGDEVIVKRPIGDTVVEILDVSYVPFDAVA